jgi:hypothetical protein
MEGEGGFPDHFMGGCAAIQWHAAKGCTQREARKVRTGRERARAVIPDVAGGASPPVGLTLSSR